MRNQIRHKFISLMKFSSSKLRFLTLKLDLKSVGLPPKRWAFAFVFMSLFLIFAFQNCKSGIFSSPSLYDKASTDLEPTPEGGVPNNKGDSRILTTTTTEGGAPNNRGDSRASTTTTTTTTLLELSCENKQKDLQKASKSGPNLTYKPCAEGEKCVDILFVVDNSISMPRYYDRLAYKFSILESELQDVNWQMAIINSDSNPEETITDPEDGYEGTFYHLENQYGEISYNNQKITVLTPELGEHFHLANLFLHTIKCPDRNDRESIFEYHFVSVLYATQLHDSAHDHFFRDGADFVVILFTDEGDHGTFLNYRKHRSSRVNIDAEIDKILGASKEFVVHGIFHKERACQRESLPHEEAKWNHKIIDIISQTNGIQKNICDEDHTEHLKSIGQAIKGQNQ